MGSVLPTSLTEIARPIVVHGFKRGLMGKGGELGKSYRALSIETQQQLDEQASWFYTLCRTTNARWSFRKICCK